MSLIQRQRVLSWLHQLLMSCAEVLATAPAVCRSVDPELTLDAFGYMPQGSTCSLAFLRMPEVIRSRDTRMTNIGIGIIAGFVDPVVSFLQPSGSPCQPCVWLKITFYGMRKLSFTGSTSNFLSEAVLAQHLLNLTQHTLQFASLVAS